MRMEGGIDACRKGKRDLHAIAGFDRIGGRLPENIDRHGRSAVFQTLVQEIRLPLDDSGDIGKAHRSAVMVSNDERRIFVGHKELIVILQHEAAVCACECTGGDICVGPPQSGTDLFHAYAKITELQGVEFDTNGRLRTAADSDLPDSGDLGYFLGQDGIGDIIYLWPGGGIGRQGQNHNRPTRQDWPFANSDCWAGWPATARGRRLWRPPRRALPRRYRGRDRTA